MDPCARRERDRLQQRVDDLEREVEHYKVVNGYLLDQQAQLIVDLERMVMGDERNAG